MDSGILFTASLGTPSSGLTNCVSCERIDDGGCGLDDRDILLRRVHGGRLRSAMGIVCISKISSSYELYSADCPEDRAAGRDFHRRRILAGKASVARSWAHEWKD